jgi:hypothetical protein
MVRIDKFVILLTVWIFGCDSRKVGVKEAQTRDAIVSWNESFDENFNEKMKKTLKK